MSKERKSRKKKKNRQTQKKQTNDGEKENEEADKNTERKNFGYNGIGMVAAVKGLARLNHQHTKVSFAADKALLIDGGRQDKLRPGDLLGALTGDVGLPGDAVGAISIGPKQTFVAIARLHADLALRGLQKSKIKGRSFRARRLG